jgi:glycine dehydrogenase subunit 1
MRYLPLSDTDRGEMLARIGVNHVDELFADVPKNLLLKEPVDLPRRKGELEVERILSRMSAKNISASSVPFFVGAGAYKHHVPATVDHLIQRSEFLTSYTPYQPEIAQGTLQYLFEFQTQVAALTGMDVANASMYDGSTGTGEAVLMAHRVTKRRKAVLSGGLHPHYADVVRTLSDMASDEVVTMQPDVSGIEDILSQIDDKTSCVVVQTPDVFGNVRDLKAIADKAHQHGALLIAVFTEAVSLGLLKSPGSQGADIVVGEGQSIGNALNFGGPYVGLFATQSKYIRQMPGRLCGETVDADGNRGFVLTLSTREQHIRRDKATSNICTNSGLCSLHHSHDVARRGRPVAARAHQSCECGEAGGWARGCEGRRGSQQDVLQRIHREARKARSGRGRAAGRKGRARGRARVTPPAGRRPRQPVARRFHRSEHR